MKELSEFAYKHDLEISDRYVNYSSEILRLSLLGIGGFGTFLLLQYDNTGFKLLAAEKVFLFIAVLFWTFSAGLSLAHRYFASDTLAYHIRYLILPDDHEDKESERIKRRKLLKRCTQLISWGAGFFICGTLAFAAAVFLILLK